MSMRKSNPSFHFSSYSLSDLPSIGETIVNLIDSPTVITLSGDLGAGKTTLAKEVISKLTALSEDEITSPTFAQVLTYEGTEKVHHFDLYRLEKLDDFIMQGFDDYLEDNATVLIEWPEIIHSILPKNRLEIEISHSADGKRELKGWRINQ